MWTGLASKLCVCSSDCRIKMDWRCYSDVTDTSSWCTMGKQQMVLWYGPCINKMNKTTKSFLFFWNSNFLWEFNLLVCFLLTKSCPFILDPQKKVAPFGLERVLLLFFPKKRSKKGNK